MLRKTFVMLALFILAAATAYADFYVVGAGGRRYRRTVIVSPVPGNPAASGAALLAAYNGVTGATAADPWLVKVEPGVYDLGANTLFTQGYVDLEGSGPEITTISGGSTAVQAGDAVEIRELSIVAQASATTVAMSVSGDTRLFRLRIETLSGSGMAYGLTISNAAPELRDVVITVTGAGGSRGLDVDNSQPSLVNVSLQADGAGPNTCIYAQAASVLDLTNCALATEGGTYGFGAQIYNTTLNAVSCRFEIDAVTYSYAIRNGGGSQTTLMGCQVLARGAGTERNAVLNMEAGSTVKAQACELIADTVSPAADNNSVRNVSDTGSISLHGCSVGDVYNVANAGPIRLNACTTGAMANHSTASNIYVGASQVAGTVTNPGYFTCTGAYDAAYTALDASCQ